MHLCDDKDKTSSLKTLILSFFVGSIVLLFNCLDLNDTRIFAQIFEFSEEDYIGQDDSDSEKKERKENIDTYNKKALEFIEAGQYEKAIEYYEQILEIDSQNHEALLQKQKLENQIQQNKNIQQQDQNTFNDNTEAKISTNNSPIIRYDTQLNTTLNMPKKIKLNTVDREGNKLTTTIIALPKYGSLKADDQAVENNIVTYTPNTNYVGIDNFTLKIDNGKKYYENRVIINIQDLTSLENIGRNIAKFTNETINEINTSSSVLDTNKTLSLQNNTTKITISNETSKDKRDIIPTRYIFEKKLGENDNEIESLSYPISVALDSQNAVYVIDSVNDNIQKFDSKGNYITSWGEYGGEEGQFVYPDIIAVDNQDVIYVSDSYRIQKFDSKGNYITSWGKFGDGKGQLSSPHDIAFDHSNNIYVADSGNSRIQKFDSNGNYITSWGGLGDGKRLLSTPEDIAVNQQGFVFVVDNDRYYNNYYIQIFKPIQTSLLSESNRSLSVSSSDTSKMIDTIPDPVVIVSKTIKFTGEKYSDVTNSKDIKLDSFTISLWFNTKMQYTGKEIFLINKGGMGNEGKGNNLNYALFLTDDKIAGGFETETGEDYLVYSTKRVNDGTWHNAIITLNKSSHMMKLYVDGIEVDTNQINIDIEPDTSGKQSVRLGANSLYKEPKSNEYYTGMLDDVKVWKIGFTQNQVQDLYKKEHDMTRE